MIDSNRATRLETILIIHDEDTVAADLERRLICAGYVVRRARSANEALITLESIHADLIFTSLMLPDSDGLVLCSSLKARFSAPIVALAGRANQVDRALALQSGAVACLDMLVDPNDLVALARAVMQSPVSAWARPG
jgi:DNA-binding response OmpR family regulator